MTEWDVSGDYDPPLPTWPEPTDEPDEEPSEEWAKDDDADQGPDRVA
jgi:hypothetical protein